MSSKKYRNPHPQNNGGGYGGGGVNGSGGCGGNFIGFGSVLNACTSSNKGNSEGDVNVKRGGEI